MDGDLRTDCEEEQKLKNKISSNEQSKCEDNGLSSVGFGLGEGYTATFIKISAENLDSKNQGILDLENLKPDQIPPEVSMQNLEEEPGFQLLRKRNSTFSHAQVKFRIF